MRFFSEILLPSLAFLHETKVLEEFDGGGHKVPDSGNRQRMLVGVGLRPTEMGMEAPSSFSTVS